MKLAPPPRRIAVAAAACVVASGSWALSLGRAQGPALIGRPLDVSVPVQVDASEAAPECVAADLFYGDSRIDASRVSTELLPAARGAMVRVRSGLALNEPVVTLYLRLGCTNRSTRRLVLLAEPPDPAADVSPAAPTVAAVPAPAAAIAGVPPEAGTTRGGSRPARETRAPVVASATAPAVNAGVLRSDPRPAGRMATVPRKAAPPAAQARLKIEPLDPSAPREPVLRLSDALATPADATAQQRAAASALWQALNARPDDVLRTAQRLEGMDADLRSLRQAMLRNDAALAELRGQLRQARSERYANPLVYLLAALALGGVGAALWMRRRAAAAPSASPRWWGSPDMEADSQFSAREATATLPPAPTQPADMRAALDLDLDATPVRFAAAKAATRAVAAPVPAAAAVRPAQDHDDFQPSRSSAIRSLRAEELHDVQQEADFFFSLGEYERAIDVLRSHIDTHPQTSAVAWLDLLEMFHRLDRRADYEAVRAGFQRAFNAEVPEFDAYRDEDVGLEAYPNAIARIVALWPSRRVLDVIEESIFRGPHQDAAPAFSLPAYRELLLLHHVGTELFARSRASSFADSAGPDSRSGIGAGAFQDSGAPHSGAGFPRTNIHPLSAVSDDTRPATVHPELGLDLNLDDLAPANEASMREPDSHLLDFDLPDIDLAALRTRKAAE